ncbi:unnamed protein product [Camellia sinensis]
MTEPTSERRIWKLSSPVSSMFDHNTPNDQTHIRNRLFGSATPSPRAFSPIKTSSSMCSHMRRTIYNGGCNPQKIAPAVQIRSVIPVCAAPPLPVRPTPHQPYSLISLCWFKASVMVSPYRPSGAVLRYSRITISKPDPSPQTQPPPSSSENPRWSCLRHFHSLRRFSNPRRISSSPSMGCALFNPFERNSTNPCWVLVRTLEIGSH